MDFPAHPFWDFALRVYKTPGVSDACLAIQDRHRADRYECVRGGLR